MKKTQKLTSENKGKLINDIVGVTKLQAKKENKYFDAGELFFKLVFMEDKKLVKLHSLIC
jgi:hypothetical protein